MIRLMSGYVRCLWTPTNSTWLNQQVLRGDGSQRESGNGLLMALSSNASLR